MVSEIRSLKQCGLRAGFVFFFFNHMWCGGVISEECCLPRVEDSSEPDLDFVVVFQKTRRRPFTLLHYDRNCHTIGKYSQGKNPALSD